MKFWQCLAMLNMDELPNLARHAEDLGRSLQMSPGLTADLPIMIGGFSEHALRRAARHDGWVGAQHEIEEVANMIAALRDYRSALGKTMDNFDIALGLYQPSKENFDRCEELGVTMLYRDAFCDANGMASTLTLHEKLKDMESFANRYLASVSAPRRPATVRMQKQLHYKFY